MSVGHVQRALEATGTPAVGIFVRAFGHIPALMGLSRALITDHPMGRPLGRPHDDERHIDVLLSALRLLDADTQSIVDFGRPY